MLIIYRYQTHWLWAHRGKLTCLKMPKSQMVKSAVQRPYDGYISTIVRRPYDGIQRNCDCRSRIAGIYDLTAAVRQIAALEMDFYFLRSSYDFCCQRGAAGGRTAAVRRSYGRRTSYDRRTIFYCRKCCNESVRWRQISCGRRTIFGISSIKNHRREIVDIVAYVTRPRFTWKSVEHRTILKIPKIVRFYTGNAKSYDATIICDLGITVKIDHLLRVWAPFVQPWTAIRNNYV